MRKLVHGPTPGSWRVVSQDPITDEERAIAEFPFYASREEIRRVLGAEEAPRFPAAGALIDRPFDLP